MTTPAPTPLTHEQAQELLGAYAVHALSFEEHTAVDAHLASCDECRREVDELLDTASLLGSSGPSEMPDVWSRIRSEIEPAVLPPPLRLPPVSERESRWTRIGLTSAAAVIVLAGVFSAGVAFESNRSGPSSEEAAALQAAAAPKARTITLSSTDNVLAIKVVVLPDGRGFVYDGNLPDLPAGRTYQLWAVVNDSTISAAIMGPHVSAVPFTAAGDVQAFAITEEVEGGVVSSTQKPVAVGKLL